MTSFSIIPDFLTPEREAELISHLKDFMSIIPRKNHEMRTRFARSGWDYLSDSYLGDAPSWVPFIPGANSWTYNEYEPCHVIAPHIDSFKFGDEINILSLGVHTALVFSQGAKELVKELPPRSLATMGGELRREWKHSTLPTSEGTRWSIIYRRKV